MAQLATASMRGSRSLHPHQVISTRRSTASLRHVEHDDYSNGTSAGAAGRFSLAHELAAALMPEPAAGSRLLAEEFGIEFDEGAEGIDGDDPQGDEAYESDVVEEDPLAHHSGQASLADEFADHETDMTRDRSQSLSSMSDHHEISAEEEYDAVFGFGTKNPTSGFGNTLLSAVSQDPLKVLSENLETMDLFLGQLRRLDGASLHQESTTTALHPSAANEPSLEMFAASLIRRIDDVARERESQVRELQEYEREFKKISGEIGGDDVLANLEELEYVDGLLGILHKDREDRSGIETTPKSSKYLPLANEQRAQTRHRNMQTPRSARLDEVDEDEALYEQDLLGGQFYEDEYGESSSPSRNHEEPPPPTLLLPDRPTAANAIPHITQLRTTTQSLVQSLTSLSEQAQVNGAAAADAGRKIRALKNKMGGWRSEWESAEKSRIKIERWEAGEVDDLTSLEVNLELDDDTPGLSVSSSPSSRGTSPTPLTPDLAAVHVSLLSKRIDGRKLAEEQLHGFQVFLAEVDLKTKAIMASRY